MKQTCFACPTCKTYYTRGLGIGMDLYLPGCKCPDEKPIRIYLMSEEYRAEQRRKALLLLAI